MNIPKQVPSVIRFETGSYQAQAENGVQPTAFCYTSSDCSGPSLGNKKQGACKQSGGNSWQSKKNTACNAL